MKLSAKTLKRLVKGAICFTEDKGYLSCYRYSEAQINLMKSEDYDYGWRARALFTGCVRIEFKTNARSISFDYKASESHPRSNTIDLYVDKVLSAIYYIEEKRKGYVEFSLPEGEKLVSIYMPCESRLEIKNFTIDGNYKSVKDKGNRVYIIGDSITQGAGPLFSSSAYANVLTRDFGYNVLAQGIGGYRFEPKDLMVVDGFEPDKLVVFLGTNYYDSTDYDYEGETNKFFNRLVELYPKTPILAVTPLWRNNDVDWKRFLWCIDRIKDACAKHRQISVVDGFDLVPNVDECFSDKVHPNSYGSLLLANGIAKALKELK